MTDEKTKTIEPVYWDVPDEERLQYTTEFEAIEMFVDRIGNPCPRTVEIAGFAPVRFPYRADVVATHVAESLDNFLFDVSDPENPSVVPDSINDAITTLSEAVVRDWPIWHCEEVCRETIDLVEWVREERPGWEKDITWEPAEQK